MEGEPKLGEPSLHPAPSDEDIIQRIARGDRDAMATLMARRGGEFRGWFLRYLGDPELADELVVDLFVRVWRAADRFDRSRASLRTWMYRIASNLAATASTRRTRRRSRERLVRGFPAGPEEGAPRDAEAGLIARDREAVVRRAIDGLPANIRAVVILRHYQDLPFADIAKVLGIPTGTAKSRMHRALSILRRKLTPLAIQ